MFQLQLSSVALSQADSADFDSEENKASSTVKKKKNDHW
jgi:hypothetical protein